MSGGPTITPGGVPQGARSRIQASTKLLAEWSSLQPWELPPIYEYRLGPTPLSINAPAPTPAIERMLRNSNRYADLVGPMMNELWVVEAKVVMEPGAISQLQTYVDLLHATPLPEGFGGKLFHPAILVAVDDAVIHQRANAAGLQVIVFWRPWVGDYLNTKYWRRRTVT